MTNNTGIKGYFKIVISKKKRIVEKLPFLLVISNYIYFHIVLPKTPRAM